MQALPHHYRASALSSSKGPVIAATPGIPNLITAAPVEFGGPGDQWSPETLLVAAAADCFILSFKAIAKAAHFEWEELHCDVEGTLDRVNKETRFVNFTVYPRLVLSANSNLEKAHKLLVKAETSCLVLNSMHADRQLKPRIKVNLPTA